MYMLNLLLMVQVRSQINNGYMKRIKRKQALELYTSNSALSALCAVIQRFYSKDACCLASQMVCTQCRCKPTYQNKGWKRGKIIFKQEFTVLLPIYYPAVTNIDPSTNINDKLWILLFVEALACLVDIKIDFICLFVYF